MNNLTIQKTKKPTKLLNLVGFVTICISTSREEGIRTLDMLPYTRFPSVRLQPLGHLSIYFGVQRTRKKTTITKRPPPFLPKQLSIDKNRNGFSLPFHILAYLLQDWRTLPRNFAMPTGFHDRSAFLIGVRIAIFHFRNTNENKNWFGLLYQKQ